ncbi:MAG: terminase [Acidobacteria bacterium]|nr:MAG: terminase [Acidobacteriota bacterium]
MNLSSTELRWHRAAIEKSLAEDRLVNFIRMLWPVVEPGREFIRGWAIDAICEHLEAVTSGEIKRLLINVPPGFMKSLATCVFWPAWEWGPRNRADLRYIFAGYVGSLTVTNNMKLRRLVESDTYQALWGNRVKLADDQNAKTMFENTRTGFALATSVGGAVMGKRGDRAILDDPNNTKDVDSDAKLDGALQFLTEVLPTRVNDEQTFAQVTIMQRTGDRDVSGHILSSHFGDVHLCIPMEWRTGHPYIAYAHKPTAISWSDPRTVDGELAFPERFSREGVDALKIQLASWGGDYAVAGQLDQLPIPRGGGMFAEEWFDQVCELDEVPAGGVTVRSWDFAGSVRKTSPFTASTKIKRAPNGKLYLLDVTCDRIEAAGLEDHVAMTCNADAQDTIIDVPQDPGQAGKVQVSAMARRFHGRTFLFSPESGSKEHRAQPIASQCKAKNLILVRGAWNRGFVNEAKSFPRGMFKDRIDALSRGYARLVQGGNAEVIHGGFVG